MASREFEQELEKRVQERTAELIRTNESLTRQLGERKGVEVELKDARARLQHVLAVTPAIIYTNQASGDYACTFVSESLQPIMGYAPQEMLDDPDFWTTHLHPQDARHVLADVFRLIGQGGGTVEYRFRHRDGHYRWFQDTFKVIPDEAGRPFEIVGSWADITQRKLAESFHVLYQASLKIQDPMGLKKWGDDFLRKGREVLHLDRLSILLADPDGQWLRAVASTETDEPLDAIRVPIGPEGGGLAQAYLTRQAIVCDGQDPVPEALRLKPPYDQIEAFRSRVFAIMPLVVQGQAIGVLEAGWKYSRRPFDAATLEPLQLLATQAALAFEHTRLYAAAQPVLRRSLAAHGGLSGLCRGGQGAARLRSDRGGGAGGGAAGHGAVGSRAAAGLVAGRIVAQDGGHRRRLGDDPQGATARPGSREGADLFGRHLHGPGGDSSDPHASPARRRETGRRLFPRQPDAGRLHGARPGAGGPRGATARAGDPECAALPRDRGEGPPARDRQPAQVPVPRQHEPRAAHPAERHPGLHGADPRRHLRRGAREDPGRPGSAWTRAATTSSA